MDNPLFFLLLGILVIWVGSYFYSLQYNRGKLRALAEWLRPALPILGGGTSSRWHGSDRLDVLVEQGRQPLREAAIVLGLQSRQFFKLLISMVRGGRDSLSILTSLQEPPQAGQEFEIWEARGPLPKTVITAAQSVSAWEIEDFSPAYKLAFRTPSAQQTARQVLTLLLDDGFAVRRLSVRAGAPHLFLILNMNGQPQTEAAALLRTLRQLAEDVSRSARPSAPSPTAKGRLPKKLRRLAPDTRLPTDGTPPAPGLDPGLTLPRATNGNGHSNGHHPIED